MRKEVLLSQFASGTSRVEITPRPAISSMGGFGKRAQKLSQAVNYPLFAKALYLDHETGRVLMITAD